MFNNFRGYEEQKFHDANTAHQYNVSTSHPLIPNSQQYMYYKKYISIHSEDRDVTKFPDASEFEIEVPQDLLNVSSISLVHWTFPIEYDVFSAFNSNITMTFLVNNPYNPNEYFYEDQLTVNIFECLFLTQNDQYTINIESGTYTPEQMSTELTNKFNEAVTLRIQQYFSANGLDLSSFTGYDRFVIVYNTVSNKFWFGNRADGFILTNSTQIKPCGTADVNCNARGQLPDFSNWGLPGNLGLVRSDMGSNSGANVRFYYGDVFPGDNGYWLNPYPNLPNCQVFWVDGLYKGNLTGSANIYMEIEGQNCIDETSPFNISGFTRKTNETNGIVNSSFAKIPINKNVGSHWFDRDALPYKYYLPPAERMRRFKIRLRYHDGQRVDFGGLNYSFVLKFTLMSPQILREARAVVYPPSMTMGR